MSPTTAPPATTPIPVQLSEPEFQEFILPHLTMPKRGPKGTLGYYRVFSLVFSDRWGMAVSGTHWSAWALSGHIVGGG